MATVSFITVTYNSAAEVAPTLEALGAQLETGDEVIVVDNDSSDGTPDRVREALPLARVIPSGGNIGFGAACNLGARQARGDLLVFLNPDAVPLPGFRTAIAAPAAGGGWDAWMGVVTQDGGRVINSDGGVVHFTGIAWAGGSGQAVEDRDQPDGEPGFLSGAALAVPADCFERVGGFSEPFFLYHEDVDLSLRIRLAGGRLGVAPQARVDHAYEFDKGPAKWRYLERNRFATLIRTYPAPLLALLAPALVASELALLVAALAGGWLPQKLRAYRDTVKDVFRLISERREIQSRAQVSARDFARPLVATLDSPYLGSVGRSRALATVLSAYWSGVVALLGLRR